MTQNLINNSVNRLKFQSLLKCKTNKTITTTKPLPNPINASLVVSRTHREQHISKVKSEYI